MEFLEFIKEKDRMCKSFKSCNECLFFGERMNRGMDCHNFTMTTPEKVVAVVEAWVRSNPKHTYKDELLSKFPTAQLEKGIPDFCVDQLFGTKTECDDIVDGCEGCWNNPYTK